MIVKEAAEMTERASVQTVGIDHKDF